VGILIEAGDSEWQPISDCLLVVAEFCKSEGHYIWYRGRHAPWLDREIERLTAHLGLTEQFAWVDEYPTSPMAAVLKVTDSSATWAQQLAGARRG